MFNFSLRRAFKRIDANPTPEFKARLKAQILPDTRRPTADTRATFHPFRILTLSAATLVLIVGLTTLISPSNVNKALAEAIKNTFSFNTEGFHHMKVAVTMNTTGSQRSWIDEIWSDGTHSLSEHTLLSEDATPYHWGSSYYDAEQNIECDIDMHQTTGTCSNSLWSNMGFHDLANPSVETQMNIQSVNVERAVDSHGDLYFTWITEEPLTNVTYIDTSYGPYGYAFATWNGTYSWKDDAGQTVNRVTWFSDDRTQSPFKENTNSFLVQIQEVAPEDVGSSGPFEGTYLAQSPVYLIDLDTMTVTPVTDEWLQASRTEFNAKLIRDMASTDAIARAYEQSFMWISNVSSSLSEYRLISSEDGVVTYDLNGVGPILNTTQASRAEFMWDPDNEIIRDMKLFSKDGTIIYHVELLTFEEKDAASEGFFSQEAWEARASEHR